MTIRSFWTLFQIIINSMSGNPAGETHRTAGLFQQHDLLVCYPAEELE